MQGSRFAVVPGSPATVTDSGTPSVYCGTRVWIMKASKGGGVSRRVVLECGDRGRTLFEAKVPRREAEPSVTGSGIAAAGGGTCSLREQDPSLWHC